MKLLGFMCTIYCRLSVYTLFLRNMVSLTHFLRLRGSFFIWWLLSVSNCKLVFVVVVVLDVDMAQGAQRG